MNEQDWMCRTELLITKEKLEKLTKANVLIVGLGGVGGYAAEQICRAGVGNMTLVDHDTVNMSNKNRQLIALESSINKLKCYAFAERFKEINPKVNIKPVNSFIKKENALELLNSNRFDYVIDAIDSLYSKVELLEACIKTNTPVVSSFGSGGKLDPSQVQISEIEKSHHCKFGSLVRKLLHTKGIYTGIKVVFSPEEVQKNAIIPANSSNNKRSIVGTISYMPAIFGCLCASVAIRNLLDA